MTVDVQGDTGANIIQLSTALTQSGLVSVDLKADTASDQLIFNADTASFVTTGTLGYTSVSNFDTGGEDDFGLFYGANHAFSGGMVSGGPGSTVDVLADNVFVEQDKAIAFDGASNYDSVSEIRSDIAAVVDRVADADKFLMAEYNSSGGQIDAYLFAGSLDGITTADLVPGAGANAADSVEVAPIAKLLDVTQNSIAVTDLATSKSGGLST